MIYLVFAVAAQLFSGISAARTFRSYEKALSVDVATSLDYLFNSRFAVVARLLAAHSGQVQDMPMNVAHVIVDPPYEGDQRELQFLIMNSFHKSSGQYVGYESSEFISYKHPDQAYLYRPPNSADTSCPASYTGTAYTSGCRETRHYGLYGIADRTSTALYSQSYDPTARAWYTNAKALGKPTFSKLITFASGTFGVPKGGVVFSVPFYDYSFNPPKLLGIPSTDFSFNWWEPLLETFGTDTNVVYLVETSTYYLAGSSILAAAVSSSGSLIKASLSANPIIANTARFLDQMDTTWLVDGDYTVEIDDVLYSVNLATYKDATGTLDFKLIVANPAPTTPLSSDYMKQAHECLTATIDEITRAWDIVMPMPLMLNGYHGTDVNAPLSTVAMIFDPVTSTTNPNQQTTWGFHKATHEGTHGLLVSQGAGYETTGVFSAYVESSGVNYNFYRGPDGNNGCPATASFPGYTTSCATINTVNADGTPTSTVVSQSQFDPRTRVWYTTARNAGVLAWSPLYTSAFKSTRQQSVAVPIYSPGTQDLLGVSYVSMNLQWYSDVLANQAGDIYTAYVVHKADGYLMGTSVGLDVYSGTAFVKAVDCTNDIIRQSYSYIVNNDYRFSSVLTTSYVSGGKTYVMTIHLRNMIDATSTNDIDIVFVSVEAETAAPTASPTEGAAPITVVVTSEDDDTIGQMVADGVIVSAFFVGVIMILMCIFAYHFFYKRDNGKGTSNFEMTSKLSSQPNSSA